MKLVMWINTQNLSLILFLIVPSDGNTGEVSYVLIVQQPEDKNKGDGEEAIGVYDFDNENEFDDEDVDNLDDKSKIRKIKPSQQVILLELDFLQH